MYSSEYDERTVLIDYVLKNYFHLMTKLEYALWRIIVQRDKARFRAQENSEPGSDPIYHMMVQRICERADLSPDDEVVCEALANTDAFYEQVCDRILDEHADKVFVNRCPECSHVVRTPRARLCLWCGHDWH